MENKYSKHNNNAENIVFSNNTLLNFIFAIGFFNLLYIYFLGLPSLKILSYLNFTLFTLTCVCSLIFIYFLFKILLFEIFFKKINQLIE